MFVRIVSLIIVLFFITIAPSSAWKHGINTGIQPNSGFTDLRMGGGGWAVGFDVNSTDGTMYTRTDSAGGYRLNRNSNTWQQCITQSSMPVINFGFYPSTGGSYQVRQNAGGVYELVSSPNNSAVAYLAYNGRLFKGNCDAWTQTNFGLLTTSAPTASGAAVLNFASVPTWIKAGSSINVFDQTTPQAIASAATIVSTTATTVTMSINASNGGVLTGDTISFQIYMTSNDTDWRMVGKKMAVDPINSNVVYFGTPISGLFASYDGGGTFSQIPSSSVPISGVYSTTGTYPAYNIVFDPSSGTTTCPSGGGTCTKTIYTFAWSSATAGSVYVSTDGGNTWAATASGPTTGGRSAIAATGGILWALDSCGGPGAGTLWKYASGSWSQVTAPGTCQWHTIAIDPATSGGSTHIVIGGQTGDITNTSNNNGSTWLGSTPHPGIRVATDVPWLAWTNENYMSSGDMHFDPNNPNICGTSSNCLGFSEGIGFWYTTPSTSSHGQITWTSLTAGIENLDPLQIIVPVTNAPIVALLDRATMSLTPGTYPSVANPIVRSFSLAAAHGLDYASTNPNFWVSVINGEGFGNFDWSGYNDGTGYLPWNSFHTSVSASNLANNGSGLVRVTMSDTSALTTWANGVGSIVTLMTDTTNPSNQALTIGCCSETQNYFPVTVIDSTHIDLQNSTYLSSYTSVGGNYLVVVTTAGVMSNFNGYLYITSASSDGGNIKLTFAHNYSGATNGQLICLSGTSGAADGCWVTKNISSGTATLVNSTFVSTFTGVATQPGINGGYIAAASTTQFLQVPEDNDYPYCTQDGGKTWTQINAPSAPSQQTITNASWNAGIATYTTSSATNISSASDAVILAITPSGYNSTLFVPISGAINTLGSITAGSGYVNGTYTAVPLTGGTGTTAQATIVVSGGAVTTVTLTAGGKNYAVSDNLSASNANLGGSGSGFAIPVSTVSNTGGTTIVVPMASNPGTYVSGGVASPFATGWGRAYYLNQSVAAADRVTANTFYVLNYLSGLYTITNCSASLTNAGAPSQFVFPANNDHLKTVPAQAGHFFYIPGTIGGQTGHPTNSAKLWRTCNAGVTMQSVPGFFEPLAFGFGVPKAGNTYSTIYVMGWYSATNSLSNAVYGLYRGDGDVNNGASGTCSGTQPTWTFLTNYPNGSMLLSQPGDVTGDPVIYGRAYLLTNTGGGAVYGTVN